MDFLFKAVIAGTLIALASWLSEKRPELAGFIIALPITSIIALTISQVQTHDSENSIIFAKSIIIGVPLSYLFCQSHPNKFELPKVCNSNNENSFHPSIAF